VIEFQPSSWSRGSYLNSAVNWLWNPKGYLSFDAEGDGSDRHSRRVDLTGHGQYIKYESDEQFEPLARQLAALAAEEVERLRGLFPTVQAAAEALRNLSARNLIGSLDAGIALGLAGDEAAAVRMLSRYIEWFDAREDPQSLPEHFGLRYQRAKALRDLLGDGQRFREQIHVDIREARTLLKLDPSVESDV
jgi:hypothetical protein